MAEKGQWTRKVASYLFSLSLDIARKHIMSLYNGDFHKVLLKLTDSPHREVQYNCAGIIGHLAMNGKSSLTSYMYKYMLYCYFKSGYTQCLRTPHALRLF